MADDFVAVSVRWCLLADGVAADTLDRLVSGALSMSQAAVKKYDSTVARIAGNILSGFADRILVPIIPEDAQEYAVSAVRLARAIVQEVERTEPVRETDPS